MTTPEHLTEAELGELADQATQQQDRDMIEIARAGVSQFGEQLARLRAGDVESVIAWLETEQAAIQEALASMLAELPAEPAATDSRK